MQKRKLKGNRGVYKCHTFGTLHRNTLDQKVFIFRGIIGI